MARFEDTLVWLEVFWPRPFSLEQGAWLLRRLAAERRFGPVVFETMATGGRVRFLVGVPAGQQTVLGGFLVAQQDHLVARPLNGLRPVISSAVSVRFYDSRRLLDIGAGMETARSVLAMLAAARPGEILAIQMVLHHSHIPQTTDQTDMVDKAAWWRDALRGVIGLPPLNRETPVEAGVAVKAARPGFTVSLHIGVDAGKAWRREQLGLGLLGALGTAVTPGIRLGWRHISAHDFTRPLAGSWWWPGRGQSRLSVDEIPPLLGWPIARQDDDLPGLPPAHPRLLPLPAVNTDNQTGGGGRMAGWWRVVAVSDAPATWGRPVSFPTENNLTHLSVMAPTGAGKSTLLWHLVNGDMAGGHGVVVVDPKGDLVQAVLSTVPKTRQNDVVVLDPTDQTRPVGFNPLHVPPGASGELAAEAVTGTFMQLWPETGIRTLDVLSAAVGTLTRRNTQLAAQNQPNTMTLLDVPRLLGDPAFQHQLLGSLDDEVLAGFWAEHNALSAGQRAEIIAPVMRRLRQFLAHATLRAVLGQAEPTFDLAQVFTCGRPKILLVPLNKALLGSQTAQLFGSLLVARLWNQILGRARTPAARRRPVSIIIDEAPDLLHLPLSLGDALAQARGYGAGFTLAAQFRHQWPLDLRDAVDANTLSKICFRLPEADARHMAKQSGDQLVAQDFMSLDQYQIYATLAANGHPGDWFSAATMPPPAATSRPEKLRHLSRQHYGQPPHQPSTPNTDNSPAEPFSESLPGRKRRPS